MKNCVTDVNTIMKEPPSADRNEKLKEIANTISVWLAKNGAFTSLENACDKFVDHPTKGEMAKEIKAKLEIYRGQLNSLIASINAI